MGQRFVQHFEPRTSSNGFFRQRTPPASCARLACEEAQHMPRHGGQFHPLLQARRHIGTVSLQPVQTGLHIESVMPLPGLEQPVDMRQDVGRLVGGPPKHDAVESL